MYLGVCARFAGIFSVIRIEIWLQEFFEISTFFLSWFQLYDVIGSLTSMLFGIVNSVSNFWRYWFLRALTNFLFLCLIFFLLFLLPLLSFSFQDFRPSGVVILYLGIVGMVSRASANKDMIALFDFSMLPYSRITESNKDLSRSVCEKACAMTSVGSGSHQTNPTSNTENCYAARAFTRFEGSIITGLNEINSTVYWNSDLF